MESFAIVEQAVTEAAVANGLQVTLYNPEGVADQAWHYYFSGGSLAAVGKDLTILENVALLRRKVQMRSLSKPLAIPLEVQRCAVRMSHETCRA